MYGSSYLPYCHTLLKVHNLYSKVKTQVPIMLMSMKAYMKHPTFMLIQSYSFTRKRVRPQH